MFNLNSSNFLSFPTLINEFNYIFNDSIIIDINTSDLSEISKLDFAENINLFNSIPIETIHDLSALKNEVEELIKIFPSMEDDIELLDL
jgi:hypothetical protein